MNFELDFENTQKKVTLETTEYEKKLFTRCLVYGNHREYAILFNYISDFYGVFVKSYRETCKDEPKIYSYAWDSKKKIYFKAGKEDLIIRVQKLLTYYFDKLLMGQELVGEQVDITKKIVGKLGGTPFVRNIVDLVKAETIDIDFVNSLDKNPYVVNFKNGLVNFKNWEFRERTWEDRYTVMLDYDFHPRDKNNEESETIRKKLINIIYTTCNCDKDTTRAYVEFLGYSLLGVVKEQLCIWGYGPSSCNGKSTLLEMIDEMFGPYVRKIDNETFEKNFTKKHKQFADLAGKRIVYVEEMSNKQVNVKLFKDLTGSKKIGSNEVMFGTTRDIPITWKFFFLSNNLPSISGEKAVCRRGMLIKHKSVFVNQKKYNETPKDKRDHIHVMDKNISTMMEDDKYKLALFHIISGYTRKYILRESRIKTEEENLLSNPNLPHSEHFIEKWKNTCKELDPISDFLDRYYKPDENDKRPVTDSDIIYVDTVFKEFIGHTGLNKMKRTSFVNELKKHGIKYNRQKTATINKKQVVGFLIGMRRNKINLETYSGHHMPNEDHVGHTDLGPDKPIQKKTIHKKIDPQEINISSSSESSSSESEESKTEESDDELDNEDLFNQ